MGFLIDTSLCIAIERGKLGAADTREITKQAPIHLSPVNVAEIRYGIDLMKGVKQRLRAMNRGARENQPSAAASGPSHASSARESIAPD